MVEEDSPSVEPEDDPRSSPRSGSRKISTGAIVAIAVAALVVVGTAFWAIGWSATSDDREDSARRSALTESWKTAQAKEAPGVDFELEISNSAAVPESSLSFDHRGIVTVDAGCFEASSEYIVLEDGSLAIQDLSNPWQRDGSSSCENSEFSSIFWTSKVSFSSGSWTAYGADGAELLGGLEEKHPPIELQFIDPSE